MNDLERFEMLMHQFFFAEEVRCKAAVDSARREYDMMQNPIYLCELLKAQFRKEYFFELWEKVIDLFRPFSYNK